MCLAAMDDCSPDRVVFITTREDDSAFYMDGRKYFELSIFYDEFGKPWDRRRMPMVHGPHPGGIDV